MYRIISENVDLYAPNNEDMSESIIQNWTQQALECYMLNCDCKRCSVGGGKYSFICQMPKVIDSLLETIGEPKQSRKTA